MVMQPRLDLRQTQSLVMTPQLQQAIKLLQLSSLDLAAYVEQELERNPLLERGEAAVEVPPQESLPEVRRDSDSLLLDHTERGSNESPLDIEIDNSFDEGSPMEGPSYDPDGLTAWSRSEGAGGSFEDNDWSVEDSAGESLNLRDHLIEQISMDLNSPGDRMVALALIDCLDEAGYLVSPTTEIADGLGTTEEHVAQVLQRLQRCDPAGLFARSLRECLALQLQDRNRYDPAMEALLDHLDLLARRDFPGLLKVCGVDSEDLQEMIAELRSLDPKPACRFDNNAAAPVIPDVLMRLNPEGGWIVELNPETLPRVLVNNRYFARVSKSALTRDDKSFITENFQSASWLVKSLDQRANTILKVAAEIVRQQNGFFEKGIQGLRPLILRDIAAAIEMHESTVSRVTSNKYIATPRGIYELKYFFTQALSGSDGGDNHSAEAVRHRIKTLIDNEPPAKILSDDAIVEILKKEGVDIARRTVAKYREGMKIASSVQRRREKAMLVSK